VTSDAGAFVATDYTFTTPLLFKMAAYADYWVTDHAQTWATLFPSTMSGYTNALVTYHTAALSGMVSEIYDVGTSITGDWSAEIDHTLYDGAVVTALDLNTIGPEAAKTITGATNATPIVLTITGHGYEDGNEVEITGVGGNTAANGYRRVTYLTADTVALQDLYGFNIAGNGAYTSGGTSKRWVWESFLNLTAKTTARFVRTRIYSPTGTLEVRSPGTVRCAVVSRSEGGTVTAAASGPTTVLLSRPYNAALSVVASAIGASGHYAMSDNIEISGARGVQVGRVLLFDGTDDYVTIPDVAALRVATPMTLEAWIKLTQVTGVTQVIARKDTETGTRYMWGLQVHVDGNMRFVYYNGTVHQVYALLSLNQWVHVAMTISGTTLTGYVDGEVAGSVTITGTQGVPTGRMAIGAAGPWTGGASHFEFFRGRIDEVRVWNVARTQAQIKGSMSTILAGSETGLVGYHKFDLTGGTTSTDSSPTANNGTLTNGPLWRPFDGLDLYRFDASGTQQAGDVSWLFQGV
jgi:Concanavalin A-like lectin/glucanases superfamily